MAAWIAFSLSFVLVNLSYVTAVISDPFGWGWDLFGTASFSWTPLFTQAVPGLQVVVLVGGLVWSVLTVRRLATEDLLGRPALLQSAPLIVYCFGVTLALMGAFIA
jgi:hypothetical protein